MSSVTGKCHKYFMIHEGRWYLVHWKYHEGLSLYSHYILDDCRTLINNCFLFTKWLILSELFEWVKNGILEFRNPCVQCFSQPGVWEMLGLAVFSSGRFLLLSCKMVTNYLAQSGVFNILGHTSSSKHHNIPSTTNIPQESNENIAYCPIKTTWFFLTSPTHSCN